MTNVPSGLEHDFIKKTSISSCTRKAKFVAVLSYLTLFGWVVAMIVYGKNHSSFASFHLRQSIGLIITCSILSLIPLIGWALNIAVFIAWFAGLYAAIKGNEYVIPVLGNFYQKHLDFIQ